MSTYIRVLLKLRMLLHKKGDLKAEAGGSLQNLGHVGIYPELRQRSVLPPRNGDTSHRNGMA